MSVGLHAADVSSLGPERVAVGGVGAAVTGERWTTRLTRICMNHQNYAKYLSVYYIMLVNLPQQSKDLLQANGFSLSRSDRPASRTAADMTMEQTINKHAKPSGGIVGFSRSQPAYYTWCVTRHNSAQYVSATYQMANIE
ncbi:hypothetical protein PoB_001981700 [Plakobranchus ocellatus]|uniref:Uncharacterized protein n=1 Tax=Plakobranchus ocellatus TaxID=259542 RepID=A0AAV3ZFP0_9GAST|nr:hypothetical protein PoB_001981700 [Plakobranchus ocellatus]